MKIEVDEKLTAAHSRCNTYQTLVDITSRHISIRGQSVCVMVGKHYQILED